MALTDGPHLSAGGREKREIGPAVAVGPEAEQAAERKEDPEKEK
jgi:hypothetical protein